jgi:putative SOS response-associated peptidase YedK
VQWQERLHGGLVPFLAEEISVANRMINARAETSSSKPGFRSAFRKRRRLIPAEPYDEGEAVMALM